MSLRPSTPNLLTTVETAVFNAIERAARGNRPCPKNSELADVLGAMSNSAPIPIIKSLEAKGIIIVRRFGMKREVEIVATGQRTLHEGSRKPHWRLRETSDGHQVAPSLSPPLPADRSSPASPGAANIDRPRVARDPCPRCGARGDAECGHPRAWPSWAGGSYGSTASSLT